MAKRTIKSTVDNSIIALGKKLPFQSEVPEPMTEERARCEQAGGTWDGTKCIMPKPKTAPEKKTEKKPEADKGIIRDQDTGRVTGFTNEAGDTFLGTEKEIGLIASKDPYGNIEAGQAAAKRNLIERNEALQKLGLTPEQISQIQATAGEAPIDWGQAITAGLAQAAPTAVGYGVTAAGASLVGGATAPAAPVIGAIGAGVGFIKGMWSGIQNNIKSQQSGEIASTQKVLTNAKSNLRQIRMLAQSDPSRADEAISLYNQQMALVYRAQAKLQLEVQGDLNKYMDDGTEKLVEFDLFLMDGGYASLQRLRLEEAISAGAPISPEQMLLELQQEMELEE